MEILQAAVTETVLVVLCTGVLASLAGTISLLILVSWLKSATEAERERIRQREEEYDSAWRKMRLHWQRRRRARAVFRGLLEVWLAYGAYKRASLVGRIDYALVRGILGIGLLTLSWDVWRLLGKALDATGRHFAG